jgi:hypothetical protein
MDPRSQNEKIIQIVKHHIKKYESKIKHVIDTDIVISNILTALHKKLDAFSQDNESYEEWVGTFRDLEKLKEAVMQKLPRDLEEENRARQKLYQEDFAKAMSINEKSKHHPPHADSEHYRPLSQEEYKELYPERIKTRSRIEALIHSDEHRALSLAQLSINDFVNENYPSTFFIKKIEYVLNSIVTTRVEEKKRLWLIILQIYRQKKDERLKIIEMKQAIINHYFEIRKSPAGSEGIFFGKGSRLGDELEKFIRKEIGVKVPHRVSAEQAPLQLNTYLEDIK